MNLSELKSAVEGVSDGGSAQVIANFVIDAKNPEISTLFIRKMVEKAYEGHHQTKEFAIAALKVMNAQ